MRTNFIDMRSLILILLYLFFSKISYSQIIVDELENPIPYVDILISTNSSFYWQTDLNGVFPKVILEKLGVNDTLILRHISFEPLYLTKKDIINREIIILKPAQYQLKEVRVFSKAPKYQKIKACFRNAVYQDGTPLYYSDGKVDYLTKRNTINYKLNRYTYRSFENRDIYKYITQYKVEVGINAALTPVPDKIYLPHIQIKKNNLKLEKKDSLTIFILTKEGEEIGKIIERNDNIDYHYKNVFELKRKKAFNTEVETTDFFIYMVFRKNDNEGLLKSIENYKNLLYYKINYG